MGARSERVFDRMQNAMELITGATGYVGSRLLRQLAGDGRAVRALSRRPESVEPGVGVEAMSGVVFSW